MKYKIEWLNNNLEIENPTIEIVGLMQGNPNIIDIDFITLLYSVDIILTTDSAKFGMTLENVKAESLNFNNEGSKMPQQVLTALNEQFAI